MDSIKSIVVVAILLGVLYGIYQVINEDNSPVTAKTADLMATFDGTDSNDSFAGNIEYPADSSDAQVSPDNSGQVNSEGPKSSITVTPPPSTFRPESSEYSSPERQTPDPSRTREQVRPSKQHQNTFNERPRSSFQTVQNPADEKSPTQQRFSQITPLNSNQDLAFKEVDEGRVEKSVASKDAPAANTPGFENSRTIPASAEADFNNPTRRFVEGSFAEFEKQVLGDMGRAEQLIRDNQFLNALKLLTKFHDDPRLTREEIQNLASWLDPLAGKVIYSEEHHLEETYFVRPNDTLNLLSVKYHVPAELIYNINRNVITDPQKLLPGTELKMVKGPFNAEISLSKKKMTLFVQGLYAGTFRIRIGTEPVPKRGKYRVLSKSRLGQDYTDSQYQRIPASVPNNPYGNHYLNIGGGMAIHGSAQISDSNDLRGCISLNAIDAEDVHNILTTESTIIIVD